MPSNFYEGWTEDQLLAERLRVQRRISGGEVIEAGGAGVKSTKEYKVSAQTVLENIRYALFILNPTDYPLVPRISRTKATVYG